MSSIEFLDGLQIPPRRSVHRGEWAPLYLEPLPGSGERLCIGIVATDGTGIRTLPVACLQRLECAYGHAAQSFAWSASLAILEATAIASDRGLERLADEMTGIEGFSVGPRRTGAGHNLDDIAILALRQSSALLATETDEAQHAREGIPAERASSVAKAVRRVVVGVRPHFKDNFGRHFKHSDSARPTVYGFVGQRVVANFASLGGVPTEGLAGQVDRAKARLWDLEQLQKGVLRDVFGAPMKSRDFELLACPPLLTVKTDRSRHPMPSGLLREAVETLESEADKFDIRWRYLRGPQEIAGILLEKEAA